MDVLSPAANAEKRRGVPWSTAIWYYGSVRFSFRVTQSTDCEHRSMTIRKRASSQEPTWCIISILGFELVNFLLLKETKHTNGVSQDNRLPAYDPTFLQSASTSANGNDCWM